MAALDLYVYYQVADANAAQLERRVRAMQADLAERCGVTGQLKRRPESKDGLQTWMEIYPATERGFELSLNDALARAEVAELIAGPRHTEVFTDLLTCV